MTKDTTIADDTIAARALLCCATGCPSRWSVDAGNGRCCSAHAWAERHRWPEITQRLQWDETERARQIGEAEVEAGRPLTREEKVALLQRLRAVLSSKGATA